MEQHLLPHNETTLAFLLAGRCYVTLERVVDGSRYTYRIEQKTEEIDDPQSGQKVTKRHAFWFVALQMGAIDETRPRYLGVIDPATFRTTRGTAKNPSATADSINLFGDTLRDLRAGRSNETHVRIFHCGRCARCGRALSTPASILTGIGPECCKEMGIKQVDPSPALIEKIAALDGGQEQKE